MNKIYYPITGIQGAWIAPDVVDSSAGYSAGTPVFMPPAENANWTSSQESVELYGNDVKLDEMYGTETSSIVLRLVGVSEEQDAWIRGKAYIAASGRVIGSGNAEPPLRALGLKLAKADGAVYIWFPKGRFSGGNVVAQTKARGVTPQMREYTFAAAETEKQFTFTDAISGTSKTTGLTWIKGDSLNPAFDGASWFDQVQTPDTTSAPAAVALSTIVPADAATAILLDATIVLTFNNQIDASGVLLLDADGALVANSQAWNAAGKILTITPTAALAASTIHYVVVAGVVDVYGQALANVVKSFETGAGT